VLCIESANPKAPWEPEWAVRVRLKSSGMTMLGMEDQRGGRGSRGDRGGEDAQPAQQEGGGIGGVNPLNVIKGIFGR
jgi:hypothetical protein